MSENDSFHELDEYEEKEIRKLMERLQDPEERKKVEQEAMENYTDIITFWKEVKDNQDKIWSAYCNGGMESAQKVYNECPETGKFSDVSLEEIIEMYKKRDSEKTNHIDIVYA